MARGMSIVLGRCRFHDPPLVYTVMLCFSWSTKARVSSMPNQTRLTAIAAKMKRPSAVALRLRCDASSPFVEGTVRQR